MSQTASTLLIGTRGSLLATTQSGHVRDWLAANGFASELHIVTTHGDVNMAPVERIGVGVFTQALREALEAGECDIAVHSFKDLPTEPDPRFHLVVPVRADARDCLVARDGLTLSELPIGAKVGTGAPRRISQLKATPRSGDRAFTWQHRHAHEEGDKRRARRRGPSLCRAFSRRARRRSHRGL